jgi:hypothetical protein
VITEALIGDQRARRGACLQGVAVEVQIAALTAVAHVEQHIGIPDVVMPTKVTFQAIVAIHHHVVMRVQVGGAVVGVHGFLRIVIADDEVVVNASCGWRDGRLPCL